MTRRSWGGRGCPWRASANKAGEGPAVYRGPVTGHYHIMLVCNYKLSYPRANPAAVRRDLRVDHSHCQIRISGKVGERQSANDTFLMRWILNTRWKQVGATGSRRRVVGGFPNPASPRVCMTFFLRFA